MGREIDKVVEILNFYKNLGFKDLPEQFINSLLERQSLNVLASDYDTSSDQEKLSIEKLNEQIRNCKKCPLSNSRTNPVCGEGSITAKLMFVGEAPGVDEDLQGRPFVGEAGKLLTSLIEKMGFKREEVYITNTVKCHPPMNRDPFETEISSCFEYLKKEIKIVLPKVIMTLGKVATYTLMGMHGKLKDLQISKIRGKVFFYEQIPVIPTFHPAYLLRNRKDKWLTWNDAQEALRRLK
ncbi:DNA polymerase [Thermodesulfovibrio aggregans]|uniref:Type-4 uracil-DNA glycosylase n=1 Tax=Thermodesulfovibrio aggregans TaxID=86166 RepID=A0A0U9HRQ5_9BACT|nr:uracil-DNA glycosylase [Thermodesulfovibrio aggregans]GAQ95065.1 DNA polymerase [Thermodesulfovibrio aggregans]